MAKGSNYLNQVDSALEMAEEDRKRKQFSQRIEIARTGMMAYQKSQVKQALENYHTYLALLEEAKGVAEGGLLPLHFDLKKDGPELKMISNIYWDLTKLYDRAHSQVKQKEFHHYLEKYVTFTRGMPFQAANARALKKYLSSKNITHREEFRNAYRLLGSDKCFIAGALIDVIDRESLMTLREFRDQVLRRNTVGRSFVCWYYKNGPRFSRRIEEFPQPVRWVLGKLLDRVAKGIRLLI